MRILVPLSQITANPFQARQEYGEIDELAADILRHRPSRPDTLGLQQVPTGRVVGDDGLLVPVANLDASEWLDGNTLRPGWTVQLEFGHRRGMAFEYLVAHGSPEYRLMPVDIRDLTDKEMLDGVWSENRARRDLSAVEEAELLRLKLEQEKAAGGSQATVAEAWGLARPTITNRLRLLELPEEVQQANRQGKLSERQCLALSTVARIGSHLGSYRKIKWGNNISDHWGAPMAPQTFIATVIEHGDQITSDHIREYQKKLLDHVGETIADIVATTAVEYSGQKSGGVVQATCKGCIFRINQHCLRPDCLGVKRLFTGRKLAQEAAERLGLPCSLNPAHFKPFNDYSKASELKALYSAGITENLVIGWWPEDEAARPFSGVWSRDPFSTVSGEEGVTGIAIGHSLGKITAEERAKLVTVEPKTKLEAKREQWEKAAKKYTGARVKRTRAAVSAALQPLLEVEPEVLRPLLAIAKPETLEEIQPDQYAKTVLEWIWSKAYYVGESRESQRKLLERVGLSADLMEPEDPAERLIDLATEALHEWYRTRTWLYGDYRQQSAALVTAAREVFGSASPALFDESDELVGLFAALDEAAEDVCKVTAEKEEE